MGLIEYPRLVAYKAGTDERLGFLDSPLSWQAAFTRSTDTALQMEYSVHAPGGKLLNAAIGQGLDIAVEVAAGGKWVEPEGGRFILAARSQDDENPQQVLKLVCPSYSTLLKHAAVVDWSGDFGTEKRYYVEATPGRIMSDLIDIAHRRGVLNIIDYDFNATTDTAGKPWTGSSLQGVSFEVGASLASVLQALTEGGYCEWAMHGRTLSMWNADTTTVRLDKSDNPIWLHAGKDITSASTEETVENLVSRALVRGSGDICFTLDNPEAPTPWGVFEQYYKMEGVGNEGTVRAMAAAELDKTARPAKQITKKLIFPARFRPLVDYWPGAWVKCETHPGVHEPVRLRQVTLTWGREGLGGNLVLNDRFTESQLVTARNLKKLTGGATVGGNGTSASLDLTPDPGRPSQLNVGSQAFVDQYGRARASVSLAWNEGMLNGGEGQYILEGRNISEDGEDAPWQAFGIFTAPQAEIASLPAGTLWEFRVAGYNGTRTSAWCLSQRITLAVKDGAGNLLPVAAKLTSSKSVALITYTGKVQSPLGVEVGLPADFARIEATITTSPIAPAADDATLVVASSNVAPSTLVLQGVRGVQVWGWTRLVDTAGNRGAWVATVPASVTVTGVTAPDLEAGAVTANSVDAGSVTAAIGAFIQATVGNLSGQSATFIKAVVDNLNANKAVLNTLWADIIKGRYIEASQIVGDIVRASELYVGGVKIDPKCMQGMGAVVNPIDYGSTSMDGTNFEVGNSSMDSQGIQTGAVKINGYGNGWIPRLDSNVLVAEKIAIGWQNGESMTTISAITKDPRSYTGMCVDAGFRAVRLDSDSDIAATGNVYGVKFVESSTGASKFDPEPVRDLTGILGVEPVAYRPQALIDEWKKQFGEPGPSRPLKPLPERMVGWKAEDLEAAGLGIFVTHNLETGEPVGVEYSRLSVALWQVARLQQQRLDRIEERLAKAEAHLGGGAA